MSLYKYTKFEYLEDIISNNSFKLSNPESYNDPFDCLITSNKEQVDECFKLILNYYMFKEFSSIINRRDIKIGLLQKPIIAWVRWELKIVKKLMKKVPFYEPMKFFDRLLNLIKMINPTIYNEFSDTVEKGKTKFNDEISKVVNEIKKSLLVCCYSKRNDSILMWSHYAESHKGICIEFNPYDDNDFKEVSYSKKRIKFDMKNITSIVLAYDYLGEKVNPKNKIVMKSIMKSFLTKSEDWKYEEEVRSIYSTNDNSGRVTFENNKYLVNPGDIVAIYVGCKMSKENENKVRELAKTIPVYRMVESETEYKVLEK